MSYITKLQWLLVIVIVTALPASARADAPVGQFSLQFLPSQGIWDVTGNYPNNEFDITNDVDLVQDEKGKITGTGTGTGTTQGITVDLVYNVTGSIKTINDVTRVLLTLKVSGTATNGSITLPLNGNIKLRLDLDKVNNILIGSGTATLCSRGRCRRDSGPVQLDIPQSPQPMDGNWALAVDLQSPDNKEIVGTGTATLSNGRVIPLTASGNYSATKLLTKLTLEGEGGILKLQNDAIQWALTKGKVLGQKVPTSP
jgi:hypothetical protein